jgi:tRNA threonylcarbamoyl adenosine modification protein YeaZ
VSGNLYPLLTVDTSQSELCLGLFTEHETLLNLQIPVSSQRSHSSLLIPTLRDHLQLLDYALSDIQTVAVCVGPGSFTGIRAGVCSVRGFWQVCSHWQVVAMSSLEILMEQALLSELGSGLVSKSLLAKQNSVATEPLVLGAVLPAGRGLIYSQTAHIDSLTGGLTTLGTPVWISPSQLPPKVSLWVGPESLKESLPESSIVLPTSSLASLSRNEALRRWVKRTSPVSFETLETLAPLYLQPPNITLPKNSA